MSEDDSGHYGRIQGSSPDWLLTNWHGRGRSRIQDPGELATTGLKNWDTAPAPATRSLRCAGQHCMHAMRAARVLLPPATVRRTLEPGRSPFYAEPVVRGAHSSYYSRRATSATEPEGFRRSLRPLPDPGSLRQDRPEGKRILPEPHGPPPHISSKGSALEGFGSRDAEHAPEPAMPRLSRPIGVCGLRESDQELRYDQAMGRKVRLDLATYRGAGRAGDLSQSFAPPRRPEDDASFFKSLKDTPTFIRFCNSLPVKAAVSPHQRRTAELHRNHASEVQRERELVASLLLPDVGDD